MNEVRELRRRLDDSQQAFATRLGLSMRAIANYEATRVPTGRALASLAVLARKTGHFDIAGRFQAAILEELGCDPFGVPILGTIS